MGTEFLVACLWAVVLVYWFWSRRPVKADTVRVYRRALRVLENATPVRVAPAYRLCAAPGIPSAVAPRASAVALCHKRAQLRRRRRDTLSVLLGAVLVTLAAALLTRSDFALVVQAGCDLALGSYVYLLVRAARASSGAGYARRAAPAQPLAPDLGWPTMFPHSLAIDTPAPAPLPAALAQPVQPVQPAQRPEIAPRVARYVPAHALRQAIHLVVSTETEESDGAEESYGDFDSYASLALASSR